MIWLFALQDALIGDTFFIFKHKFSTSSNQSITFSNLLPSAQIPPLSKSNRKTSPQQYHLCYYPHGPDTYVPIYFIRKIKRTPLCLCRVIFVVLLISFHFIIRSKVPFHYARSPCTESNFALFFITFLLCRVVFLCTTHVSVNVHENNPEETLRTFSHHKSDISLTPI